VEQEPPQVEYAVWDAATDDWVGPFDTVEDAIKDAHEHNCTAFRVMQITRQVVHREGVGT